ncbi:MAG: hypothetical protein ACR2LO_12145 [Ilumatobacteraceae bacterium]
MARSSSTNRAAKLAQRSGRARVRFQGGTLFPAIVAMVAVLGLATIVYARQSRPAEDASPPTVEDHWHASYGFYLCDPETGEMEWQQLAGDQDIRDESGQITGQQPGYARTGVHSHNDGVIHWHAFSSAATGRNADLGVFLEVYDVELSDSELKFSDDQVSGATYKEDDTKCGDQDGNLRVQVWNSFQDTGEGRTYTANFNDIRMTNDAMVYTIAFAADDVVLPMPPEAQNLPTLGAADSGQTEPPGSVPGSAVPGSTVPVSTPGSATTGSSVPGSTAPGSTAPASSAPPGTTGATTQPSG